MHFKSNARPAPNFGTSQKSCGAQNSRDFRKQNCLAVWAILSTFASPWGLLPAGEVLGGAGWPSTDKLKHPTNHCCKKCEPHPADFRAKPKSHFFEHLDRIHCLFVSKRARCLLNCSKEKFLGAMKPASWEPKTRFLCPLYQCNLLWALNAATATGTIGVPSICWRWSAYSRTCHPTTSHLIRENDFWHFTVELLGIHPENIETLLSTPKTSGRTVNRGPTFAMLLCWNWFFAAGKNAMQHIMQHCTVHVNNRAAAASKGCKHQLLHHRPKPDFSVRFISATFCELWMLLQRLEPLAFLQSVGAGQHTRELATLPQVTWSVKMISGTLPWSCLVFIQKILRHYSVLLKPVAARSIEGQLLLCWNWFFAAGKNAMQHIMQHCTVHVNNRAAAASKGCKHQLLHHRPKPDFSVRFISATFCELWMLLQRLEPLAFLQSVGAGQHTRELATLPQVTWSVKMISGWTQMLNATWSCLVFIPVTNVLSSSMHVRCSIPYFWCMCAWRWKSKM